MTSHFPRFTCIFVAALGLWASVSARGDAVKWDYLRHPVAVTENRPAPDPGLGLCVASAFDGYGALGFEARLRPRLAAGGNCRRSRVR